MDIAKEKLADIYERMVTIRQFSPPLEDAYLPSAQNIAEAGLAVTAARANCPRHRLQCITAMPDIIGEVPGSSL